MVNHTNNIAHTMQLKTVAEFVENHSILEELQKLGVDYVQGYHICKPFPLKELTHGGEWSALYPQDVDLSFSQDKKLTEI